LNAWVSVKIILVKCGATFFEMLKLQIQRSYHITILQVVVTISQIFTMNSSH